MLGITSPRLTSLSEKLRGRGVVSLCAILMTASSLSSAHAETLMDALADAYFYSPRLDAQRATLRGTDEDVAAANSGYRPSINAQADVGRLRTETRPNLGSNGTTSPRGYTFQLVQPIFRGFRTTNAVNQAEALVRAGRETLRQTEQEALLDAVQAYADVVRDEAILKLSQSNLDFLNTELKATKDRFAAGELTKTDVAQAEARTAEGVATVAVTQANLKASRAVYERAVGHAPGSLVPPNPKVSLVPSSLQEAIGIGNQENPAVVAALYQEQAAKYQVEQIRGELLPEAQLEATFTERFDPSQQIEESETASIVGRVNVPIYPEGGAVYARVRKAKHEHVSRIQQIEQARSQAQQQVASAWSQLQGARAQKESNLAAIEANKTALFGVKEEEKVGQRVLVDVLDVQRELLQSQITLERTKRDIILFSYQVVSATGRLNIAELGAVDSAYNPEAHYLEVRRKAWGIDITHDDGSGGHGRRDRDHGTWGATVHHERPIK